MRSRIYIWLSVAWLLAAQTVWAEEERRSGYYTMVDKETGQIICRTGQVIYPGDEYLTSNNLRYRVIRLDDATAWADFLGREELEFKQDHKSTAAVIFEMFRGLLGLAAKSDGAKGPVAIYHTHDDESYVPTDGEESERGSGGVLQVGTELAEKLENRGIKTVHSKTSHFPHDGLAYERSRRTAADLLKKNPVALLDIHRDAAPRQEYADTIDDQGVTKVQIVLGRTNPNLKANEEFAKQVKAIVDRKYPGFIKGIYYGRGKYNQDLSSRALLLEFGAHTNARQSAERAAAIFASAASQVVAPGSGAGGRGLLNGQGSGAWRSILYVLGGVALIALFFLVINAGSFREARRNLGRFFRRESTSALGLKNEESEQDEKRPEDR